jgi:anti-anti-sigma factor
MTIGELPPRVERLMEEFAVSVEIREGCQVVSVRGELDADTAPDLAFELDRLLGALPVLIDLSQVKFLTSAGIVILLSERAFGRPALFCPDGSVSAKLLTIVQAQRLVPIYRDLDAALHSLGAVV